MSLIRDFAGWFKARETKVEAWYEDGVGKFAFRVTVDGQAFVCAARSSTSTDGTTSIMKRVAGKAQVTDALILLQTPGGKHVFDPVTVLHHGTADDPNEDERRERGEEWVRVDTALSCGFREWYDGTAEPTRYADVSDA